MEINHYGDTVMGVVLTADTVEGRMVLLTAHSWSKDFGSQSDLPGAKVPATAAEAIRARYCITWEQDNRATPIYLPNPAYSFALRQGWDQAQNAPFAATVYLTHPGVQEGLTIPSGSNAVAFGEGIYTVPSGAYIWSADVEVPGNPLDVADTATDGAAFAGMLHYGTTSPVAEVYHFDTATSKLTFKILH